MRPSTLSSKRSSRSAKRPVPPRTSRPPTASATSSPPPASRSRTPLKARAGTSGRADGRQQQASRRGQEVRQGQPHRRLGRPPPQGSRGQGPDSAGRRASVPQGAQGGEGRR